MLTVLGGLAEFERELIRARTGDGRKRAQARGVSRVVCETGNPPLMGDYQSDDVGVLTGVILATVTRTSVNLTRRPVMSRARR